MLSLEIDNYTPTRLPSTPVVSLLWKYDKKPTTSGGLFLTWDDADAGDASRLKRSEVIASFGEGPIDITKNPPFLAGFFMGWWRWGELNPRPMQ